MRLKTESETIKHFLFKSGELQTVFENGQIIKEWSLSEIRARINQSLQ